jgi:hypothetical protein
MQVKMEPVIFRVIVPEVVFAQFSSWGWTQSCSEHVEVLNKRILEEIVRQVDYLPELQSAKFPVL